MSAPATSQAPRTVKPLGILKGKLSTEPSMASWGKEVAATDRGERRQFWCGGHGSGFRVLEIGSGRDGLKARVWDNAVVTIPAARAE